MRLVEGGLEMSKPVYEKFVWKTIHTIIFGLKLFSNILNVLFVYSTYKNMSFFV